VPLSQTDKEIFQFIEHFSIAEGILEFIFEIPYDLKINLFRIPLDIANFYNFNLNNIWNRNHGKPYDNFHDLTLDLAYEGREELKKAKALA